MYIENLTERYVSEEHEIFELMKFGNENRSVSSTLMNEESSRSHLIFMLTIYQKNLEDMSAKSGRLFLVDLAGSEK